MQPDLGIAAIITTATMVVVAILKQEIPKMAGCVTVFVALAVSLVGVTLAYLPRGITAENACEVFLTFVVAWGGSVGVAWKVRQPQR